MSESLGDILAPGRHTVLMKVRPNTVLAITGLAVVVLALVAALLLAVVLVVPLLATLFRFSLPPAPWLAGSLGVALVAGAWSGVARLLRGP